MRSAASNRSLRLVLIALGASLQTAFASDGQGPGGVQLPQPAAQATSGSNAASADEGQDEDGGKSPRATWRWQMEVKRQSTNRGTAEESTKTTLRVETLSDGPISLLRLDLPFPDEDTDFEGSPFNPRPGDIKVRVAMKAVPVSGLPITPYFEITFPTANPESLGSGKYQLAPAIQTAVPWMSLGEGTRKHQLTVSGLIQQVVSVAGDESRKDINYTKFELALRDTWRKDYSAKLTFKPVIDWLQNAKTGAVGELEGAVDISRHWRVILMVGGLLWGAGVPNTYGERVELTLRYRF